MRIVGVIAEYNPFHLGHAHQLRQAREAAHADAVVAVMSGCFVQRGDAAIVSPAVRAKMALQNGADAVILLPKNNRWSGFLTSLDMFTADFMPNGREQPDAQERESL